MWDMAEKEFSELIGKTLIKINGGVGDDEMVFIADDGHTYKMYHYQD